MYLYVTQSFPITRPVFLIHKIIDVPDLHRWHDPVISRMDTVNELGLSSVDDGSSSNITSRLSDHLLRDSFFHSVDELYLTNRQSASAIVF